MEDSIFPEGFALTERLTLERELGRSSTFCVFRARHARYQHPLGVTIFPFPERPSAWREQVLESLRLVRLSDFGSSSQRRMGGSRRGQICHSDCGSAYGRWYEAWHITDTFMHFIPRKEKFSRAIRRALLEEAGNRCKLCGNTDQLEVDHIVPVAVGGMSDLSNGIVLCQPCHRAKTALQARCHLLPTSGQGFPNTPPRYYLIRGKQFFVGHAPVYYSKTSPYYLKLFDHDVQVFTSERDLWLWITTYATQLLQTLP